MAALKQMGEHDLKELGIPMVFSVVSFILLFLSLSFVLQINFQATSIANFHFTRFLHFLACPLKCSAMSFLPLQKNKCHLFGGFCCWKCIASFEACDMAIHAALCDENVPDHCVMNNKTFLFPNLVGIKTVCHVIWLFWKFSQYQNWLNNQ